MIYSIQRVRAIGLDSVNEETQGYEKIGKTTIEKDVENKQILKISSPNQVVKWNVRVNFGYPLPENESIQIVDQVDENLTIEKIDIQNQDGESVRTNGRLSVEKNKVVFEIEKKENSYIYLENQSYKMTIFTKINDVN